MGKYITDINQLDLNGTYSYADYLLWRFKERVELFKGKIFEMSPAPNLKHQRVSLLVTRYLDRFFENQKCGLFVAPFDVRLINFTKSTADNTVFTVVQPDLCVICDQSKLDKRGCIGSPDLVVEILSPGNSKKELGIKFNLYEENGVLEYWIINQVEESVLIYSLVNGKYIGTKPLIDEEKIISPLFQELDFEIAKIFVDQSWTIKP